MDLNTPHRSPCVKPVALLGSHGNFRSCPVGDFKASGVAPQRELEKPLSLPLHLLHPQ
ncbi:hypothetical protein I79_006486 [Cricetulus griseus]|uniref:Uncharacterized protein n=1 Tax=Cricetulus griseus TaxID=10029 RepID=G3H7Z0_CRIGR|nr:hypothetical protein I79_006486 [Cricetulus griseus]